MDEMTVEKEAMRLSARERALLADALLQSLSDEATQQIQGLWAAAYYQSLSPGLGVSFVEEVGSTVDRILLRREPNSWKRRAGYK